MFQIENKRSITICAGISGTGKSTFVLRYLVNADLAARFCFDPDGEFASRLRLKAAGDIYQLSVAFPQGWVLFDPHVLFAGRVTEGFAFFCEWAFVVSERIPGAKVLVVDEVWRYCTPSTIPEELALATQTGRKRGLGLLVNTQLPNKINGSILNECSELVAFRLQHERALEKTAEFGFNAEELKTLPDLSFVATWTQAASCAGGSNCSELQARHSAEMRLIEGEQFRIVHQRSGGDLEICETDLRELQFGGQFCSLDGVRAREGNHRHSSYKQQVTITLGGTHRFPGENAEGQLLPNGGWKGDWLIWILPDPNQQIEGALFPPCDNVGVNVSAHRPFAGVLSRSLPRSAYARYRSTVGVPDARPAPILWRVWASQRRLAVPAKSTSPR